MSAEHIQGRLEYGEDCDSEWWIARVGSTEQIAYTVPVRPGVARANARRLVACWNALQDFSTEALEHRSHLLKAEDDQIAMLTTQRDELLEACIQTVEENGHLADGENCTLIHLVRAIAKVEGEKT